MSFQLARCDAFDFLHRIPRGSVHLIVTDPPYESLEKHRGTPDKPRGTTTRLRDWFPTIPNTSFDSFFAHAYRVLVDNAHLYVVCDPETAFEIVPYGKQAGFHFWKPLIWDKVKIGMGYHYRSRYEMVLFFEKGKRAVANLGIGDVIPAERIVDGYPTQKPVKLLSTLVRQSASPGEVVVDPFMGSGSTGLAAHVNGCHFVGCDVSDTALTITRQRLESQGSIERLIFPSIDPGATVNLPPARKESP